MPDLPIVGRRRGGVDDNPALLAYAASLNQARGELRQNVERAQQVDRDDLAELGQRQRRSVAIDDLGRGADPCAVDEDAGWAIPLFGCVDGLGDLILAKHISLAEMSTDLFGMG